MTFNSEQIIQEVRAEFEGLVAMVTSEPAQKKTAYELERSLFQRLLKLGAQLLQLFFVFRAAQASREPIEQGDEVVAYHSERRRRYVSIFGVVYLWRPYFYRAGEGGQSPLDAELSLGTDSYSDMVREMAEYLGVYVPYGQERELGQRFFGWSLSTRAIQDQISHDAAEVIAFYEHKPPPAVASEAEILVLQADGKGVPLILAEPSRPKRRLGKGHKRGHKKEAIVTSLYTIAARPRTPVAVLTSFFNPGTAPIQPSTAAEPRPQNKQVWATLAGKETALDRLAGQVHHRQGDHIRHRVALADGCEALQTRLQSTFPDFSLVLDFVHANEYLWQAANALWAENDPQRIRWVAEQTLQLLTSHTDQVIVDLRCLAQAEPMTLSQRQALLKTADYFQRNLPLMDYQTYLHLGWPIASGVIEGACRHLVKDRFELSGMRWSYAGAEARLHLRAVAENDDGDAYHAFRRQRRHTRLYPAVTLPLDRPETQALATPSLSALAEKQPISFKSDPSAYQALPFAL